MDSERHNLSESSRIHFQAERVKLPVRLKIHQPYATSAEKSRDEETQPEELYEGSELRVSQSAVRVSKPHLPESFIHGSASMAKLIEKARRYARSNAPILVTGESGTGKELFSRFIHAESRRSDKPFVAVNCAALPELIAESELFGHERGAFTGAFRTHRGHFENADKGTLLLDEISEIPISTQAKLLRAIEEQEVQRLGSSQPARVDVRIIATSNRDLQNEIRLGTFRLDLYHRVGVLILDIPPLRDRLDDVPGLATHYAQVFCREGDTLIAGFTSQAMEMLCQYRWPGNIRELRNVIHSACIESTTPLIDGQTIGNLQRLSMPENQSDSQKNLADIEKLTILKCLEENCWNKTQAAAELGVTPRTLSNKLKIYRAGGIGN